MFDEIVPADGPAVVCGFPWPARQKPTDVGQSLGLPEQLGVVNAKHQDRSILVSLCTRVRIYYATVKLNCCCPTSTETAQYLKWLMGNNL